MEVTASLVTNRVDSYLGLMVVTILHMQPRYAVLEQTPGPAAVVVVFADSTDAYLLHRNDCPKVVLMIGLNRL